MIRWPVGHLHHKDQIRINAKIIFDIRVFIKESPTAPHDPGLFAAAGRVIAQTKRGHALAANLAGKTEQ